MAAEVRHYTAAIPAGTAIAHPVTVPIVFPPRIVNSIDWRVAPGSQGVMGWQLAMGGVLVLPTSSDQWVIADGTSGTFTLDNYPDSGAWQVIGYNTGSYPHSVFLTFHLDLPSRPAAVPAPIHPLAFAGLNDLSKAGPPVRMTP
jgi:hypothetical protein